MKKLLSKFIAGGSILLRRRMIVAANFTLSGMLLGDGIAGLMHGYPLSPAVFFASGATFSAAIFLAGMPGLISETARFDAALMQKQMEDSMEAAFAAFEQRHPGVQVSMPRTGRMWKQ